MAVTASQGAVRPVATTVRTPGPMTRRTRSRVALALRGSKGSLNSLTG